MNGRMLSSVRFASAALAFTATANSVTSVPGGKDDSRIMDNTYLAETLKSVSERMMFLGRLNHGVSSVFYDGWT